MNLDILELKENLLQICKKWVSQGLPSRERVLSTADELFQWKQDRNISGLWQPPPLMVTATLDDGIGQGLDIIERFARLVGISVTPLGLLHPPDTIIRQCRLLQPDILGLTILQIDSDDALAKVGYNLPANTRLIAGGPVFKYDSEMAQRCKVDYVAVNVAYFIEYLLDWDFE